LYAIISPQEARQLRRLALKDQAFVLQHRLGDGDQRVGRTKLQALTVDRLSSAYYTLSHALLATLPHSAAVTTNSDLSYDAACEAAGIEVRAIVGTGSRSARGGALSAC
jgi:hypothetical protein